MTGKKEFLAKLARSGSLEQFGEKRIAESVPADGPGIERAAPPPALIPFADMDYWYLSTGMDWSLADAASAIHIPRGFTTDFASIPSLFWSWMPPTGRYGLPAIVHDWLYWDQSVTRERADAIFDAALADLGVSRWRRFVLFQSVNWFGGRYWNENSAAKARNEGRILRLFPDDARITWADWRARPGVFV